MTVKQYLISIILLGALCTSAYSMREINGAVPFSGPPNIVVTIVQPANGALAGNDLRVAAAIDSTFEVASVKAIVEGRETSLVFSSTAICTGPFCSPGWTGTLSLAGLARGGKTLTVIATDVFGNTGQSQRSFVYDQAPALTLTAPLAETVARPAIFVDATCTDDDPAGCTSLTAIIDEEVLAVGKDSIKGFLFLTAYDGRTVTLSLKAVDSRGQATVVSRMIYVEASNNLSEVEPVSGRILDVQPDRILFLDGKILKVRTRASGVETVVMNDPVKVIRYGFLAPKGAVFVVDTGSVLTTEVYDWRDGSLINLGKLNSSNSLKVKGNYAIWNLAPPLGNSTLFLRDLFSGTNTEVSGPIGNTENDVSASGDVVYWTSGSSTDYNVFRYREGANTRLTNNNNLWNTYPLTDGINVVYRKHTPCCGDQTYAIVLYAPSGELILSSPRVQEPGPGVDYQVNGGWTAFTRPNISALQVWTRSTTGEETQISFYGSSSSINALSPVGGVVFSNGGRSYLKETTAPAVEVGSNLGNYFWQDGEWFATIGRSLFRVNTSPSPVPTILTEQGSQSAIALNATTSVSASFPTNTIPNFSPDSRTRVALLTTNVSLTPGDNTSAISVQAEDSQHRLYSLPVEFVGRVPNFDWLTQINVILPGELQGAGNVWVNINVRGVVSNRGSVRIQ